VRDVSRVEVPIFCGPAESSGGGERRWNGRSYGNGCEWRLRLLMLGFKGEIMNVD
jgi:hypothetical protein